MCVTDPAAIGARHPPGGQGISRLHLSSTIATCVVRFDGSMQGSAAIPAEWENT